DRRGGSHWAISNADLRLWRDPEGVRATLEIEPPEGPGPALEIAANRPAGAGRTDFELQFSGLGAEHLARLEGFEWLRGTDGTFSGEASAALGRDGTLGSVEGVITASDGVIAGLGDEIPFEVAE